VIEPEETEETTLPELEEGEEDDTPADDDGEAE
jgi:hypothetical protein